MGQGAAGPPSTWHILGAQEYLVVDGNRCWKAGNDNCRAPLSASPFPG